MAIDPSDVFPRDLRQEPTSSSLNLKSNPNCSSIHHYQTQKSFLAGCTEYARVDSETDVTYIGRQRA